LNPNPPLPLLPYEDLRLDKEGNKDNLFSSFLPCQGEDRGGVEIGRKGLGDRVWIGEML